MKLVQVVDTRGIVTWMNLGLMIFAQQHGNEAWFNFANGTVICNGTVEQILESHKPEEKSEHKDPKQFSKLRKMDAANAWIKSPDCPAGFESKFLISITEQFKENDDLTEKQEEGLDNLIRKFKIDVEKFTS